MLIDKIGSEEDIHPWKIIFLEGEFVDRTKYVKHIRQLGVP